MFSFSIQYPIKQKNPVFKNGVLSFKKSWQLPIFPEPKVQVFSALKCFTSEFGMEIR